MILIIICHLYLLAKYYTAVVIKSVALWSTRTLQYLETDLGHKYVTKQEILLSSNFRSGTRPEIIDQIISSKYDFDLFERYNLSSTVMISRELSIMTVENCLISSMLLPVLYC
jgi:hypothetical protein